MNINQEIRSEFERHWKKHEINDLSLSKYAEASGFLQFLIDHARESEKTLRILDVGCGDGIHAVALVETVSDKFSYWGIDLSAEAVKMANRRMNALNEARARFQAGDALSLPYESCSFDAVFSYGVLAYTGAVGRALDEIVRVCKPGGLIGIWVYPKMGGVKGAIFDFTRKVCRIFGGRLSKVVVWIIVPFLPILPVRSGVNLCNSTWNQCVEVVEVNLLPELLEFYTSEEIQMWFSDRQLKTVYIVQEIPVALWARV